MKKFFLLVLFFGFICLFTSTAFGGIIYVPGQYSTIQAGINAAFYGDTVQVAAGIYYEHITMKSGVIIQGAGAGDNPSIHSILDGGGTSTVVTAINVDSTAKIAGFKITNGLSVVGSGSGMYNENSSPTVANCTFSENSALLSGGGMFNDGSSPTVIDCTFSENSATSGGGLNNYNSSPTVTNCTFSENSADLDGGGMWNDSSSATVTDCAFSGNVAGEVQHSGDGGGMGNYYSLSSLTVNNCTFSGNWAAADGGGMYNIHSSPAVTNCIFFGNWVGYQTEMDCYWGWGGGMYNNVSSPTVTNCIISDNWALYGAGGIYNYNSSPTVTNCTFSGNSAGSVSDECQNEQDHSWVAGGMYNKYSSPTVTNSILWGDLPFEIVNEEGSSTPSVTYSDIQGGYTGTGNINNNPMFVAPTTGDFHIQQGSPCIDTGTSSGAPSTDFEGDPRPYGTDYDIGADEYAGPPTYERAMPWIPLLLLDD